MQRCVLRVLYTSSVLFLCLKEGARATNRVGCVHSVEGRFVPMGGWVGVPVGALPRAKCIQPGRARKG